MLILTHTMYCCLLLQIYLCYLWLLLCSRVTNNTDSKQQSMHFKWTSFMHFKVIHVMIVWYVAAINIYFSFSFQEAGPHRSQGPVLSVELRVGSVSGSVSGQSVPDAPQHPVLIQLQLPAGQLRPHLARTQPQPDARRDPAQITAQTAPPQTQPAPAAAAAAGRSVPRGEHVYRYSSHFWK